MVNLETIDRILERIFQKKTLDLYLKRNHSRSTQHVFQIYRPFPLGYLKNSFHVVSIIIHFLFDNKPARSSFNIPNVDSFPGLSIFDLANLVLRDLNRGFFQSHFSRDFLTVTDFLNDFLTDFLEIFWTNFFGQIFERFFDRFME